MNAKELSLDHSDEIGDCHNRLRILTVSFRLYNAGKLRRYHFCECICGKVLRVRRDGLVSGATKSCGCLASEQTSLRLQDSNPGFKKEHGYLAAESDVSETYRTYRSMLYRCGYEGNHTKPSYTNIEVCDRWLNGEDGKSGFECFLLDMGRKPNPELSLDRERPAEGYNKDNCRWIPKVENAARSRSHGRNT